MNIDCIYFVGIVNKNELNFDHVCYHEFHMELSIFDFLFIHFINYTFKIYHKYFMQNKLE